MNTKKVNPSSYLYKLGQNIARIRKQETGLTQADMGTYSGISRAYYGRIELGLHSPTIETLLKIANALNVTIVQLFINENNDLI